MDIRDKVNETHEIGPEELALLRDMDAKKAGLRQQQADVQLAMQIAYAEIVKANQKWWQDAIKKFNLNTKELVYGVEYSEDGTTAKIIVVDILQPARAPEVEKRQLRAGEAPEVGEDDVAEVAVEATPAEAAAKDLIENHPKPKPRIITP